MWVYFLLMAVVIVIDQLVKFFVVQNIEIGGYVDFIPHILSLTHLQNTGAAWSLFEGKQLFFTIVTVIALVVMFYMLFTTGKTNRLFGYGLALMIAGALGNFIDRLRLGYVVDMFQTDFMNFPIFNVADMSLVFSVVLIFIYLLVDSKKA